MAEGMNRVLLVGNLGAEPELRLTASGPFVNLRLATTEAFLNKDRQWQERTEWHSVVVWGARAEGLARILHKGAQIAVEGSLRTSSYDDRDGVKRYRTEVNAKNVVLLGQGRHGSGLGRTASQEQRALDESQHDFDKSARSGDSHRVEDIPF